MVWFAQVPDGDAAATFDAIATASSFQMTGLGKSPVDPFRISVTDGKNSWIIGFNYDMKSVGEEEKLHG